MSRSFCLLFVFFLVGCGGSQPSELKPFTTDGCSCFPDGNNADANLWLDCCTEHDKVYWQGGTVQQRKKADLALKQCVAKTGATTTASFMYIGVRLGGTPYFPASYRWGYGWDYIHAYGPLSEEEQALVDIEKAKSPYFAEPLNK